MPKRFRAWNQSCYEKRIKNGRGSEEGAAYRPWLVVQDFSSRGSITRVNGWKTKRVHHFMSNIELQYFYLLEWSDTVIDIREQFPLLDVSLTTEIAKEAGIKHPLDQYSGFPYVLTTDFLVTTKCGLIARTIKMSHELNKRRVLEKLEIERRYWDKQGVDWRVVTENEIDLQKSKNIEWLHTAKILDGLMYDNELLNVVLLEIEKLYTETELSVLTICKQIDEGYSVCNGTGITLFKYLVANKHIEFDIEKTLELSRQRTKIDSRVRWAI